MRLVHRFTFLTSLVRKVLPVIQVILVLLVILFKVSVTPGFSDLDDAGPGQQRNRIARLALELRVAAWPDVYFRGILGRWCLLVVP